jgi:tetratricopeptide (TPR) repeat protein
MTVRDELTTLDDAELVSVVTVEPELEYAFRHALLQEAAYDLLLKGERLQLHASVGNVLAALYPDRRDELAAVLAYHFEQADDRDRAVEYLIRAGRHALARFANREAREFLDRAAEHLEEMPAVDPARRVDVALGQVQAGFTFVPFDENLALLQRILPVAEALNDPRRLARTHLLIGQVRGGQGESYSTSRTLRHSLDEVLRLGTEIGDDHVRALPLMMIGSALFNAGDYAAAIERLEEALVLLEAYEDHADAALTSANLARAHARCGDFEPAYEAARRSSEFAEHSGDPNVVLDTKIFHGIVTAEQGDLEAAQQLTEEGVALADDVGNTYCSLVGNFYLGDLHLRAGRLDEAEASLRRSQDLAEFCDAGSMISLSGAWLGAIRARQGDEAIEVFEGPVRRAHASGDAYAEALVLQLRAGARVASSPPDREAAIADLNAAATLLETLGARPALARVLRDLAHAQRSMGRDVVADETERRAGALTEDLGLVVESGMVP